MKPLINSIGTDDGQFHGGNQLTGAKGTVVTPDWLNDMQDALRNIQNELIGVLTSEGIVADGTKTNQLLAALKSLISNNASAMIGVPIPYPLASLPAKHLSMNGASFNTTTYPKLALVYPSGVLPDLRGEFLRGWDNGRGIDSGRTLLSLQAALAGTVTALSSTLSAAISSEGTAILDQISFNGVLFNDDNTSKTFTVTPGDTRPRNVSFNFICRAE